VALLLVKLGRPMLAAWRLSQNTEHGTVNAGFNNGIISATIAESGTTRWSGSISFLHLTLLVTIPPLILWVVWLVSSSRTNNAGEIRRENQMTQRELHGTESRIGIDTSSTSPSKRRVREES
jgi:hypothetical protein